MPGHDVIKMSLIQYGDEWLVDLRKMYSLSLMLKVAKVNAELHCMMSENGLDPQTRTDQTEPCFGSFAV